MSPTGRLLRPQVEARALQGLMASRLTVASLAGWGCEGAGAAPARGARRFPAFTGNHSFLPRRTGSRVSAAELESRLPALALLCPSCKPARRGEPLGRVTPRPAAPHLRGAVGSQPGPCRWTWRCRDPTRWASRCCRCCCSCSRCACTAGTPRVSEPGTCGWGAAPARASPHPACLTGLVLPRLCHREVSLPRNPASPRGCASASSQPVTPNLCLWQLRPKHPEDSAS